MTQDILHRQDRDDMIHTFNGISLRKYNTFGIDVNAEKFISYTSKEELKQILIDEKFQSDPKLILGGGSNILFTEDFHGLVLHSAIKGIEIVGETKDQIIVKCGAGVVWDDLVEWAVANNYYGIENLSLIPGSVGAAPIQNIGAYGVEFCELFVKAEGYWLNTGQSFEIENKDCDFDYRYSVFKGPLKEKIVITTVYISLSKVPEFKLAYGAVKEKVKQLGELNLKNVRKTIIEIRNSKLPDPAVIGNAGSYFKNPVITVDQFKNLKNLHPDIPNYPVKDEGYIKISAAWLIEKSGWKGKSLGQAGVHHKQALVLVNLGNATGKEILKLANKIKKDVNQKFNIPLHPEVTEAVSYSA